MNPLVSAIMPTRLRPTMAAEALALFRAQTYVPREIVIVDDETGLSFPDGVAGDDVNYFRLPNLTIGSKRNAAISRAIGSIIVHWDSDDWFSSDRIKHQVEMLMTSHNAEVVGYYAMEFQDIERGSRYAYDMGGPGHAIGTSLCYWRSTWERQQFEDREEGEDARFLIGRRIVSTDAGGRIVARIHDGNTCDKRIGIERNKVQWRKIA